MQPARCPRRPTARPRSAAPARGRHGPCPPAATSSTTSWPTSTTRRARPRSWSAGTRGSAPKVRLTAGGFRRLARFTRRPMPRRSARDGPRYTRDQPEFDRAVAFVDATFAVALTLLVTTLDVGDPGQAFASFSSLDDAVGAQIVGFVIAFAVIASYWLQHHRLFASFAAIDYAMVVVNLALIAAIVLLPFSTEAVGNPDITDLPLPTVIMALNVVAASALYTLVYAVAVRHDLLTPAPSRCDVSFIVVNALAPALVFAVSIPVAYLASPVAARIFWISLLPISYLLGRYTPRGRATVDAT